MSEAVELELSDSIAVVSLNRPKLNMFSVEMRDALLGALSAVRDIGDIRAMILRANGPNFSAGADLSEFGEADSIHDARRIRWDRDPLTALWDLPVPTVAALHGWAVGSGMELAMLCDIRLATHDTKLALPETKLAMLPAAGGTQSLTRAIGPHQALPLVLGAHTIDVDEAVVRGVVHRSVDDVEAEALAVARQLALLDRSVVRAARLALHAAGDLPLEQGLAVERRLAQGLQT